jgi:dipeptidyl aminopeptidase/acylaminoacyl peptidase
MKTGTKTKPFTPEDFHLIKEVSSPQLSPDGTKVVYTLQEVDRVANSYKRSLWQIDVNSGRSQQFTSGQTGNDFLPQWSADGRQVYFLSTRSGKVQIWAIAIDGGEARSLTSLKHGVEEFQCAPDGRQLAFISRMNEAECREFQSSKKPRKILDKDLLKRLEEDDHRAENVKNDPRVIERTVFRTGTTYRDDRRNRIFVLDLKRNKIRLLTEDDRDYSQPAWSPDGLSLFSWANFTGDEDNDVATDIVRIESATGILEKLTQDIHENTRPSVSPDGKFLAFMSLSGEFPSRSNAVLKIMNLHTNKVLDCGQFLDREIEQLRFSPDSRWVYCTIPEKGDVLLARLPVSGGPLEYILTGRRFIQEFHFDTSGENLVFSVTSPEIPSDIFLFRFSNGQTRRLTQVNKKLLAERFCSIPEEILWRTQDDWEIQGWVMKPMNFDPTKRHPCIVEIHGGPHIMWGNSFWLEFQIMAGKGYVVFFCNPRGSDGYGKHFKGAIYQNWGVDDSQDILSGLDFLVTRGDADPDQLFITGGSYGGFMTAWIIGHDKRFRGAVAQRGVYNLTSFYGCSDAQLLIEWEFDTFPWDNPELLWRHSPLAYAPNITTPLMIIHSELDFRAPINTAEELYTALKKLKREVQFIRFPREGHELSRSGEPKHRVERFSRIVGWFDRHRP